MDNPNIDYDQLFKVLSELSPNVRNLLDGENYRETLSDGYSKSPVLDAAYGLLISDLKEVGILVNCAQEDLFTDGYTSSNILMFLKRLVPQTMGAYLVDVDIRSALDGIISYELIDENEDVLKAFIDYHISNQKFLQSDMEGNFFNPFSDVADLLMDKLSSNEKIVSSYRSVIQNLNKRNSNIDVDLESVHRFIVKIDQVLNEITKISDLMFSKFILTKGTSDVECVSKLKHLITQSMTNGEVIRNMAWLFDYKWDSGDALDDTARSIHRQMVVSSPLFIDYYKVRNIQTREAIISLVIATAAMTRNNKEKYIKMMKNVIDYFSNDDISSTSIHLINKMTSVTNSYVGH